LENSEGHGPALPPQEIPLHTRYVTCLNGANRYTDSDCISAHYIFTC
jgi:hypothetical protein